MISEQQMDKLKSLGGEDLIDVVEVIYREEGSSAIETFLDWAFAIRNAVPLSRPSKACLEIIRQSESLNHVLPLGTELPEFVAIVIENAEDDDFAVLLIQQGGRICSTLGLKKLKELAAGKKKAEIKQYNLEIGKMYAAGAQKKFIQKCFAIWDRTKEEMGPFMAECVKLLPSCVDTGSGFLAIIDSVYAIKLSKPGLYLGLIHAIVTVLKREPDNLQKFLELVNGAAEIGLDWTIIGSYGKGTYADGKAAGLKAGHDAGYAEGHKAGYSEGSSAGYKEGYDSGHDVAERHWNDRYDEDRDVNRN